MSDEMDLIEIKVLPSLICLLKNDDEDATRIRMNEKRLRYLKQTKFIFLLEWINQYNELLVQYRNITAHIKQTKNTGKSSHFKYGKKSKLQLTTLLNMYELLGLIEEQLDLLEVKIFSDQKKYTVENSESLIWKVFGWVLPPKMPIVEIKALIKIEKKSLQGAIEQRFKKEFDIPAATKNPIKEDRQAINNFYCAWIKLPNNSPLKMSTPVDPTLARTLNEMADASVELNSVWKGTATRKQYAYRWAVFNLALGNANQSSLDKLCTLQIALQNESENVKQVVKGLWRFFHGEAIQFLSQYQPFLVIAENKVMQAIVKQCLRCWQGGKSSEIKPALINQLSPTLKNVFERLLGLEAHRYTPAEIQSLFDPLVRTGVMQEAEIFVCIKAYAQQCVLPKLKAASFDWTDLHQNLWVVYCEQHAVSEFELWKKSLLTRHEEEFEAYKKTLKAHSVQKPEFKEYLEKWLTKDKTNPKVKLQIQNILEALHAEYYALIEKIVCNEVPSIYELTKLLDIKKTLQSLARMTNDSDLQYKIEWLILIADQSKEIPLVFSRFKAQLENLITLSISNQNLDDALLKGIFVQPLIQHFLKFRLFSIKQRIELQQLISVLLTREKVPPSFMKVTHALKLLLGENTGLVPEAMLVIKGFMRSSPESKRTGASNSAALFQMPKQPEEKVLNAKRGVVFLKRIKILIEYCLSLKDKPKNLKFFQNIELLEKYLPNWMGCLRAKKKVFDDEEMQISDSVLNQLGELISVCQSEENNNSHPIRNKLIRCYEVCVGKVETLASRSLVCV